MTIAFTAFFALLVGVILGSQLEAHRWRRNAKEYALLESAGRVYKVTRAD